FLVQVQYDRLLLNWRRLSEGDPYPRYKKLRADFAELWQEFCSYVAGNDFGVLQPSIAEVSFFNRIPVQGAAEIPAFVRAMKNVRGVIDGQIATAYQIERDLGNLFIAGHQSIALNYRSE